MGSFWKTNPPEGGKQGVLAENEPKSGGFVMGFGAGKTILRQKTNPSPGNLEPQRGVQWPASGGLSGGGGGDSIHGQLE